MVISARSATLQELRIFAQEGQTAPAEPGRHGGVQRVRSSGGHGISSSKLTVGPW